MAGANRDLLHVQFYIVYSPTVTFSFSHYYMPHTQRETTTVKMKSYTLYKRSGLWVVKHQAKKILSRLFPQLRCNLFYSNQLSLWDSLSTYIF